MPFLIVNHSQQKLIYMTIEQHINAVKACPACFWHAHAENLEQHLRAKYGAEYCTQERASLSDLLVSFSWKDAPGGFDLWEEIFSKQHDIDNRRWWAYKIERIF